MAGIVGNRGGRPRKPTALKLIQGTARPDRMNPLEPVAPELDNLAAPSYLTATEKKQWDRHAEMLSKMRVLTEADCNALGRYCVLQARFLKEKRSKGEFALDRMLKLNVQLQKLETDFGLTPSSRSRIKATPDKQHEENKLQRFLNKA